MNSETGSMLTSSLLIGALAVGAPLAANAAKTGATQAPARRPRARSAWGPWFGGGRARDPTLNVREGVERAPVSRLSLRRSLRAGLQPQARRSGGSSSACCRSRCSSRLLLVADIRERTAAPWETIE